MTLNLANSEKLNWGAVDSTTLDILLTDVQDQGTEVQFNLVSVPQRGGSIVTNKIGDLSVYGKRTVVCTFGMFEPDYNLAIKRQKLIRSAFSPSKGESALIFSSDDKKMFFGRISAPISFQRASSSARIWTFDVKFECYDPFVYEVDSEVFNGIVLNNGTVTNDGDFYSDITIDFVTDGAGDISIWWDTESPITISGLTTGKSVKIMSHTFGTITINGVPIYQLTGYAVNTGHRFLQIPRGTPQLHFSGPIPPNSVNVKFRRRWE